MNHLSQYTPRPFPYREGRDTPAWGNHPDDLRQWDEPRPAGAPEEAGRTCYCGQLLMPFAIRCPSRKECHVENVQKKRAMDEAEAPAPRYSETDRYAREIAHALALAELEKRGMLVRHLINCKEFSNNGL